MTTITIRGVIVSDPRYAIDSAGVHHLLIGVAERNPETLELGTHYYVDAAGMLAENAVDSLLQGDSVIVLGELRIDHVPESGHIIVAILAVSVGHDLAEVRAKRVI